MGLGAKKMGSSSGSALARGDDMGSFEDTAKQAADAEAAAKRQVGGHNTLTPHWADGPLRLDEGTRAACGPVRGGTRILGMPSVPYLLLVFDPTLPDPTLCPALRMCVLRWRKRMSVPRPS